MTETTVYVIRLAPDRYVQEVTADAIKTARNVVHARWFASASDAKSAFRGGDLMRVVITEEEVL